MSVSDHVAAIPFRRLVWLLPVTFALHEAVTPVFQRMHHFSAWLANLLFGAA